MEKATSVWRVWYDSPFGYALIGAIVTWLAFPPVGLWPLAWIGPIWWLLLVRRQELAGKHPYRAIWLAGFLYWLAIYHWLTLPHWATSFGWLAMGFYHAFYLPAFIGLARVAHHGLRLPLMLCAPIVWTGLELVRAHLLTGVTMGSLAHTQYHWTWLIQISDLAGAYGVGFVVIFGAAAIASMLPLEGSYWSTRPLLALLPVMALVFVYPLANSHLDKDQYDARVALIQGSIDTQLDPPPDTSIRALEEYMRLSAEALAKDKDIGLIVWPETMFGFPLVLVDEGAPPPADYPRSAEEFREEVSQWARRSRELLAEVARRLDTPMILGVETWHYRADGLCRYNSAVHLDNNGQILGRYDKMHLVLFGEYMPWVKQLPFLQQITPVAGSADSGDQPSVFTHRKLRFSPSICYENVLPQVIRRQVKVVSEAGQPPDFLVNLTNDGWFWGSAELDMHLACAVFRAVECRKPMLVAANTGFSAHIDGSGRIRAQGRRRATDVIVAHILRDPRSSLYLRWGDWPAAVCLMATGFFALFGTAVWLIHRYLSGRRRRAAL